MKQEKKEQKSGKGTGRAAKTSQVFLPHIDEMKQTKGSRIREPNTKLSISLRRGNGGGSCDNAIDHHTIILLFSKLEIVSAMYL